MAITLAHSSSDYQLVHVRMAHVEELFYSTVAGSTTKVRQKLFEQKLSLENT